MKPYPLPPISREHPVPWIVNTLQPADGCLLVVDLSDPGCVDRVLAVHEILGDKRVTLSPGWPAEEAAPVASPGVEDDPFAVRLPTLG